MAKNEDQYDDDYDYGENEGSSAAGSLKGYKVMVLLLAVVLVGVSGLYFYQSRQIRADFAIERDTLTNRFLALNDQYAMLETSNVALNDSISAERGRVDSILDALARERRTSAATIRRYQAELGTLRAAAAGLAYTIDSLNTLNTRLISENLGMRRTIATERQRAEMAEERAADADIKIRQGSVIIARDIRITPLNANDREVTRAARAARLRIDFTLAANNLSNPGGRPVYARVTGPEGYVLANPQADTFDQDGTPQIYTAMREVDYQNSDLPVGIYYSGSDITAGTYRIEIFADGTLAGSAEALLR
ncbi:MAG: hypothetical protein LBU97_03405 [Alistipes sp.]|jgi:hypothetical protein|nr:hypothetical protein [Alistipes sp.]